MTVKERVHQLVDELPEEELEIAEQRLRELRRRTKDAHGSSADLDRRQSEETDLEHEWIADIDSPLTLQEMAARQRQRLASLPTDCVDAELPSAFGPG